VKWENKMTDKIEFAGERISEAILVSAIELDAAALKSLEDIELTGYKWILTRASLNRRCWREAPFNKAYMNWSAQCWAYLAVNEDDASGPEYKHEWIKLRYNFGSADCAQSSRCSHVTGKLRHCHGAKLTATYKTQTGQEGSLEVSV
jgi:hypothetical protein